MSCLKFWNDEKDRIDSKKNFGANSDSIFMVYLMLELSITTLQRWGSNLWFYFLCLNE